MAKPRSKPRSKPIRSRGDAINIEEIKRAVKASPGRPPGVEESELAMRRDLLALRRSLAKRLAPLIVEGVDVTKAKPILADYEKKRKKLLESKKSEVEKAMSALADSRAEAMAGQRKALEVLATPGLPFTPTLLHAESALYLCDETVQHAGGLACRPRPAQLGDDLTITHVRSPRRELRVTTHVLLSLEQSERVLRGRQRRLPTGVYRDNAWPMRTLASLMED